MAISEEEVRKVALLARLEINEAEVQSMAHHFDSIMEHFNRLKELDLEDVDPFVVEDSGAPLREDEVAEWGHREDVLSQAPDRHGDFFRVPRIVGEEGQ